MLQAQFSLKPMETVAIHTFLAVEEIVVILHRNKLMPIMLLRNVLQSLKLPRSHLLWISLQSSRQILES